MSRDISDGLRSICRRYGIDALYAFGSRAAQIVSLVTCGRPDIPLHLREIAALGERDAGLLRDMAGYRNRLVHFYSEVTAQELFHIRSSRLTDIETVLSALLRWIQAHPELIDQS